jgi:hypothetical protein
MVHGGEQVSLTAVASGAAEGLAVDSDRTSTLAGVVVIGKPSADRGGQCLAVEPGERSAGRGLGRDDPPAGEGITAGPSAARTGWGASAAHSAITAIDRAPAKTAAAASPRMATSGWRRPARASGR